MKKVISFIVALVLLLAGVVSFTGCEERIEVPYKDITHMLRPRGGARYPNTTIIDSVEVLREIDEQYGCLTFEEDSIYYSSDYYNDNEILLIIVALPQLESRTFKKIELVGEKIVVTVEKPNYPKDAQYFQEVTMYIYAFEVEKSIGQREIVIETVVAK